MMRKRRIGSAAGFCLLILARVAAAASVVEPPACMQAIDRVERDPALPAHLLKAIAIVESGRADPVTGRVVPWPWTIDVAGEGHVYATKAEAIDAVQVFQALGSDSIDVGCMQINLRHHPSAFASLEEAFDPARNVAYGKAFLLSLFRQLGDWPGAIAAYHSQTPDLGAAYWTRVSAEWPLASHYAPLASPPGGAVPTKVVADPNWTPAFAAQMREAEEDHRRILQRAGLAPAASRQADAGGPGAVPTRSAWRRVAGLSLRTNVHTP